MTPTERRKRDEEDLRAVLGMPAGRRFLNRVLVQAGLYSGSYAESPTATAYNEGRRSLALALLQEAKRVSPELYARGLREALDAEERDSAEEKKAKDSDDE